MPEPRLHLNADTSIKALQRALEQKGYDVSRTPNTWMAADASDEMQLLGATAQGRCVFTFNVRGFLALARRYPQHGGIIVAVQQNWMLAELVSALDRLLSSTDADDWPGGVRWLNEWRQK